MPGAFPSKMAYLPIEYIGWAVAHLDLDSLEKNNAQEE